MSSTQRLVLLAGAVIVLGGAFLLFSGSDDNKDSATVATRYDAGRDERPGGHAPVPAPEPKVTTIVVNGGKPAGGIKMIKAVKATA